MALNPIDLLKERVTPQIVDYNSRDADSESALLDQFYPVLLGIFAHQPQALKFALEHPNAIFSDILPQQAATASLNQLLDEFSRHHNIPVSTVNALFDRAVPLSAQALQADIAPASVLDHLRSYLPIIVSSIPAWAIASLSTLGFAGLFNPAADIPVVVTGAATDPANHMPIETQADRLKKQLPWWIGLIALLLLMLFLWRSCQHEEPMPPMTTSAPVTNSAFPASINLTVGRLNNLLACNSMLGSAALNNMVNTAVNNVFGTQRACNNIISPAYNSLLPAQDKLETILKLVKPYENASLMWTGNQLIINSPDGATISKLVEQIRAIAPELNVAAVSPLNVDQSVNSSIEVARQALTGLSNPIQANDVARALNLQIINFASDSAVIPDINKPILDQAAAILRQAPHISLMVEGYTDATSNPVHNQVLSDQRAKSVVAYLIGQGVTASQLHAIGYGEDNPIADNVTEQGKFRNRRIEFRVTDTQTGHTRQVNDNTAVTSTAELSSVGQSPIDSQDSTVIASGSGTAPVSNP